MLILLVFLSGLFIFLILNHRYVKSSYYQNLLVFENRFLNISHVGKNVKIINLGSVHSRFAFEYFNGEGINLAQSPQSLFYDLQILRKYINIIPEGTVIIEYLPFFLFALDNYSKLNQMAKYYGELPPFMIHNYSLIRKIVARHFPILFARKQCIRAIINKLYQSEYSYETCIFDENERQLVLKNHIKVWQKQFILDDFAKADLSHLKETFIKNRERLNALIDCCEEHKVKLVLVTGPVSRALNESFKEDFLEKIYYSNFIDIVKGRKVLYLNYQKDEDYQNNPDLFWNGVDWLSRSGRRLFMEKLKRDLKQNNYM